MFNCATGTVKSLPGNAASGYDWYKGYTIGAGYKDGIGTNALFNGVWGVAFDTNSNIYLADYYNNALRRCRILNC